MIHLTLEKLDLLNPAWSSPTLKPGVEVTMEVEAPGLAAPQFIQFEILRAAEIIDVVKGQPGKTSAKWIPPNLPGANTLKFRASFAGKPAPENGQVAVVAGIDSPNATLTGFSLVNNTIDEAFVPKQEKLNLNYTVTDPGSAAKKGRYEIWGERYPGDTPVPLYTEDFTPAAGAKTWSGWSGKANAGVLSGKYITPEFSPYKVRIVIGPDSASVKDPEGVGQCKVAIAEAQFEISVFSVVIRLQEGIKEAAKLDEHKLKTVLVIEPPQPDGSFADKERLPKPAETGRIRIPMARHMARGEALDQGGTAIGGPYSAGATKFSIDANYYTRPELPVEFEPHLKSRDNTINNDADRRGLFEKEAVGPLKIEPIAEDFYDQTRFPDGGALAGNQAYFKYAAFKVKEGVHNAPVNTGAGGTPANSPNYICWQARIPITADNTQDFDITTGFNATNDCGYVAGSNQLKVYLQQCATAGVAGAGRCLLELSTVADDSELDEHKKDYREIPSGGPALSKAIRLAPNLTKNGDILWVVRTSGGITRWDQFPPGSNCHEHYGGHRGTLPTADLSLCFRKAFSADPGGTFDKIVGKTTGTYPYTDYVNLKPETAIDQDKQERVEISALTSGAKQGLAGALFSPSFLCGESYEIYAWVEHQPYERNLGFIQPKAKVLDSKSGRMTVWRHLQFKKSLRMPPVGASGMVGGAGMAGDAGAPYRGDGVNMSITNMNAQYAEAFHEWTVTDKTPVHENIDLKKYRKAHNLHSNGQPGKVPLDSNKKVTNNFVQYDYYREKLPPNFPANRRKLATNIIAAQPKGTDSPTVGAAILAAIGTHVGPGDAALDAGLTRISVYGGTSDQYFFAAFGRWKDTIAYQIVDTLTPRDAQPRKMNAVRWENLHETPFWNDFAGGAVNTTGMSWEGECMGDGNSLFRAGTPSATLFAHEMGHSTHLAHFVGMNFCWKHHDLATPGCLMSYTFTRGFIFPSGGQVGPETAGPYVDPAEPWPLAHGGTDVEHGWPHWGPNPNNGDAIEFCIRYGASIALGGLCAKCLLKLCGWDEEKLPVGWLHPDLF
jgi:hypothetical protein